MEVVKINGKDKNENAATDADSPSLRTLPLLGVTYADLYRRTRIEETVYETMTQQYELAKVEEAKETPSVKVLDSASIPERRIFPPRLVVLFLCIAIALLAGVASILAKAHWRNIHPDDPRKEFVLEVV